MGKIPHFFVYIAKFSQFFFPSNRPEPARKVIQDDKVTNTNIYEGPGMIFQPLLSRFRLLQSLRYGKNTSFLSVHSRVFPGFSQTNGAEPARKVVQDNKVININLNEGTGMIFQPLLSRFRLLQSLRHGKNTSFLSVHNRVSPFVFVKQIDLNRQEKLFRMIKSLIPTYMKDLT